MGIRRLASGESGFTLTEMLVVLAILGIVLTAILLLFTSAISSQTDQTNRTQAQQNARVALDRLRREIHCASTLSPTSGFPVSSITITLGTWCSPPAGATTVTWCTKDKNGTAPPAAGGQPYTLWRYAGSSCSGTGTQLVSNFVDKTDPPSVAAGKIFDGNFVSGATLVSSTTGGTLIAATYSYDVTAVLASGAEVAGVTTSVATTGGSPTNKVTLNWSPYTGAVSYNVYGRQYSVMHLLKNVTSGTSYVDTGPTALADNPLTLPSATINVTSGGTAGFSAGANTIVFGASGSVTCTGTTSSSFTGCTGGQAGQYPMGMPVDSASSAHPPSATLSVSLPIDPTPADRSQRFVLSDDIVLRNSRPF